MLDTTHPIIDCRPLIDYEAGHIQGATSLPYDQLFQRMHELPQRHVPLILCGNEPYLSIARQFFREKLFTLNSEIFWNNALQKQLLDCGQLETGNTSKQLWEASPLLRRFVETIGTNKPADAQGLDIACGSGRDLVYMAKNGWQMTGMDDSEDALQRARHLAHYHQVNINTLAINLENNETVITHQLSNTFDCISVFRYLHRPLLPVIDRWLKPGGFLVYQTFMEGCELISSPRNPRFLLKRNELADHYAHFTILVNDVITLEDGRPMVAFIAQKPVV